VSVMSARTLCPGQADRRAGGQAGRRAGGQAGRRARQPHGQKWPSSGVRGFLMALVKNESLRALGLQAGGARESGFLPQSPKTRWVRRHVDVGIQTTRISQSKSSHPLHVRPDPRNKQIQRPSRQGNEIADEGAKTLAQGLENNGSRQTRVSLGRNLTPLNSF